ncbi:MAG: HD domain-containing protein [Bacteroidaceae bacterium]|nr:HD domain-containing protein [Bacteroidaceae bacterium]
MNIDIDQQRTQIVSLLEHTQRPGMTEVIDYLNRSGFFEAPASVSRHLNVPGGLACHSLNVCRVARRLAAQMTEEQPALAERLKDESIVIASLLHDMCKSNIYRKVKKYRKDANNHWVEYDTYEADASRFPAGHGEKSVFMLMQLGLQLTKDELLAIRWHMGPWGLALHSYDDKANYSAANDGFPLVPLLQAADSLATHMLESE